MPERNVHPVPVERRHADYRRSEKEDYWLDGKNTKTMPVKKGKEKRKAPLSTGGGMPVWNVPPVPVERRHADSRRGGERE